jgi:hypothetical protein
MLGVTGALHAQKGERKGGDGQLFAKLDTDGDGMVSKQEWLNGPAKNIKPDDRVNARFAKLDTDGNGALDKNEWADVRAGKGNRNRGQEGAKGRKGQGPRGARLDARPGGPGQGKGRPGPGGAGRGAGGGKRGAR